MRAADRRADRHDVPVRHSRHELGHRARPPRRTASAPSSTSPTLRDRIGSIHTWRNRPFRWVAPDGKAKVLYLQIFPYNVAWKLGAFHMNPRPFVRCARPRPRPLRQFAAHRARASSTRSDDLDFFASRPPTWSRPARPTTSIPAPGRSPTTRRWMPTCRTT